MSEKELLNLYLEKNETSKIKDIYEHEHAADVAESLEEFKAEQQLSILRAFDIDRQAEIISYLKKSIWLELSSLFEVGELARIFNVMSPDDRADLIQDLPGPVMRKVIYAMAKSEREDIRGLASYSEESVGAIMTTDYATIKTNSSAKKAIEQIQIEATEKETINRIYIVDDQRHYRGSIRLQDLITTDSETLVYELVQDDLPPLSIKDTPEYAAHQIAKYDVIALPVLDLESRLIGIVTYDDALDVLKDEATLAIHKSGTVGRMTENILTASAMFLYKKRIYWLILLVFGNIFSGAGIAYFEEMIENNVALVFFLPLLIDSGGNAGSQSATLMVRALATGDVGLRDWTKMLSREIVTAFALGLTMALAVSAIGIVRGGLDIALVVSLTMVIVVLSGSVIGMSLPFLLSRYKLDPATASAPLITSIADASGVLIYFGIASTLLD